MASSSHFWYSVPGQNSSSLIFCPMELKFGQGSILRRSFRIRAKKIRYKYVLREKKAIFYEKLKFLPKRSLTKVLPWQHSRLLLTENYFK